MIDDLYQKFLSSSGVSTDSRKIEDGVIFFALKGPNFNGNLFARQALDQGAAYAVVDEEQYVKDDRFVRVEDVLNALQQLANHHRNQFSIPFIGITGSNGKTTTKELMYAVLSKKYNTLATKGNLNNHIGVPLTLLEISEEHEMAIIEMGANRVGDIKELADIAEPDFGLITNIGYAHTEGFGGIEGVLRGKTELFDHLIRKEGVIFLNMLDERLKHMVKRMKDPVLYPNQDKLISADPYITYQSDEGEEIRTQLTGAYNFQNISAALAIGLYFGVGSKQANKAISDYVPENNRSQLVNIGSNTIILDAYNANPSSMTAAIDNLASFNTGKTMAILGDMYELGEERDQHHYRIGEYFKDKGISTVIFCGKYMEKAHQAYPDSLYFSQKEELTIYLDENPLEDFTILIKASRGMGLEDLLQHI